MGNNQEIEHILQSGILESYLAGQTTVEETAFIQRLAEENPQIKAELDAIEAAIESLALSNATPPDITIKPFVLATMDYMNRLSQGEIPTFPPELNNSSTIQDYLPWLERPDMVLESTDDLIFAKIIGYTPTCTTAIVWLKSFSPEEIHDDELEKFLVVEGTCTITIDGTPHFLSAGNYLSIPLFKPHDVKVTSSIPCKVVLQRMAA